MENLFKTRIGRKVDGVEAAKAKSVRKSLKNYVLQNNAGGIFRISSNELLK